MKRYTAMVCLFFGIVFRRWEGVMLWPWTAWGICRAAHPRWAYEGDGHWHQGARE